MRKLTRRDLGVVFDDAVFLLSFLEVLLVLVIVVFGAHRQRRASQLAAFGVNVL